MINQKLRTKPPTEVGSLRRAASHSCGMTLATIGWLGIAGPSLVQSTAGTPVFRARR